MVALHSIQRIFSTKLLGYMLIICLAIAVLLPSYSAFFLLPAFTGQLIKNIEDDANRVAFHLLFLVFETNESLEANSISTKDISMIEKAKQNLGIEKIKIFSKTGQVIYSTDPHDIGIINNRDYFRSIVAKGKIYSKIVQKNSTTAESRVVLRDVAEVYIPILMEDHFEGAFEIYYDFTKRNQELNRLLRRSSLILYGMSGLFFIFAIMMIDKLSRALEKQFLAEKRLMEANRRLETLVNKRTHEVKVTQKISIESLAVLAEYYDGDTGAHLTRIQKYVYLLTSHLANHSPYARYISSQPGYLHDIVMACVLHDIGKVAIPKEILTKPSQLTPREFEIMKTHTLIAGDILARANNAFKDSFGRDSYLALARYIALYHHEKWNGQGYPKGLKGEAIPLSARIVALADVYDALTTKRPYKPAYSHEQALKVIRQEKGQHFDPYVTEAFLSLSDAFYSISKEYKS